ncbi:unnamed protein product [Victoria cruziana]
MEAIWHNRVCEVAHSLPVASIRMSGAATPLPCTVEAKGSPSPSTHGLPATVTMLTGRLFHLLNNARCTPDVLQPLLRRTPHWPPLLLLLHARSLLTTSLPLDAHQTSPLPLGTRRMHARHRLLCTGHMPDVSSLPAEPPVILCAGAPSQQHGHADRHLRPLLKPLSGSLCAGVPSQHGLPPSSFLQHSAPSSRRQSSFPCAKTSAGRYSPSDLLREEGRTGIWGSHRAPLPSFCLLRKGGGEFV